MAEPHPHHPLARKRLAIRPARHAHQAARVTLRDFQRKLELKKLERARLQPPATTEGLDAEIAALEAQVSDLQKEHDSAHAILHDARIEYRKAAAAAPELWKHGGALPLLLLPVRIETVFQDADGGSELLIRVYPDDIHIDAHEEALSPAEREAGQRYLDDIAVSGTRKKSRAAAWRTISERLGPGRAAWVVEAMRTHGPGGVRKRGGAWTRAAHTTLLPDHFVFSAYQDPGDGELELAWRRRGADIPDKLPVGFAPPAPPGKKAEEREKAPPDGLPWDSGSRWLADFEKAEKIGMGLTVKIKNHNPAYDLLTVVGAMTGVGPKHSAARWQRTLRAHQYSAGLAFLPVGTPTNNTPATRSGWRSRPRPRTPAQVDRLRRRHRPRSQQAAARAARAFGIDGSRVLALAPGAGATDAKLLEPLLTAVGHYYSLSPALQVYPPAGDPSGADEQFQDPPDVAFLRDHFIHHVRSRGRIPTLRVGRQPYGVLIASSLDLWTGPHPDGRIIHHLRSILNAFEVRAGNAPQVGDGSDPDATLLDLLSRRPAANSVHIDARFENRWSTVDLHDETRPVVGSIPPLARALFLGPPDPSSPDRAWVSGAPTPEVRELLEKRPLAQFDAFIKQRRALWEKQQFDEAAAVPFPPTIAALSEGTRPTVFYPFAWQLFTSYHTLVELRFDSAHFGEQPPERQAFRDRQIMRWKPIIDALVEIEEQAVKDLPRVDAMFTEVLDTLSHRVDAWMTSVAGSRLKRIRRKHPRGLHVGAYGWVTNLSRGGPKDLDGYIVTPSLAHATSAAVLRSARLGHADQGAYKVDLQSWRVRRALALVDGVRTGQPLAVLLGYQFERALHDAELDGLIEALRARYPLSSPVQAEATGSEQANVAQAARNVVDGQAVRRDRATFEGEHPDVPAAAREEVLALVRDLDDAVDAVGDLLLSESVHHLVAGNPLRAGLSADAIGRGEGLPDEFDAVRTPRSATAVSHHVGLLGPASGVPGGPPGWSDDRALARLEPALEGWCRARLGPAAGWSFPVQGAAGAAAAPVTLGALGWCALDVVSAALPGERSPFVAALLAQAGGGAQLAPGGAARAAELTLLCGQLRATLAAGTPLLGTHVDPDVRHAWAAADLVDLRERIAPWLEAVIAARDELAAALQAKTDPAAALAELAALGMATASPPPGVEAAAHAGELVARLRALGLKPLTPTPLPDAPQAPLWANKATSVVSAVLGDHVKVVPVLRLALPGPRPAGADTDAVADWLRALAPVRPPTAALDDALAAAGTLAGAPGGEFAVCQSPAGTTAGWAAVSSPFGEHRRDTVRASLVLHADAAPADGALAGLVVDSWTEAVPRPGGKAGPEEVAGVAFHYDRPGARAPQSLLMAVPPDRGRGWRMEDVHGVVEDTLMLARIRGMDLRDADDMHQLFPVAAERS